MICSGFTTMVSCCLQSLLQFLSMLGFAVHCLVTFLMASLLSFPYFLGNCFINFSITIHTDIHVFIYIHFYTSTFLLVVSCTQFSIQSFRFTSMGTGRTDRLWQDLCLVTGRPPLKYDFSFHFLFSICFFMILDPLMIEVHRYENCPTRCSMSLLYFHRVPSGWLGCPF